jgi:hypothetical protein
MKRSLSAILAAGTALLAAPAVHAQATGGTVMFSNDVGVGGSFTTGFSDSGLTNPFTETLTFNTTTAGLLSILVGTTATSAANDTDFTNVFLSGTGIVGNINIPQISGDPSEVRSLAGFGVGAGTFTLTLQGTPGTQNGAFGGNVSFFANQTPAVPEPATWAMMLFGFGGLGYSMRRRKSVGARIRFA